MNTKMVSANSKLSPVRSECSFEVVSKRLFERTMTFTEVVELSEKCGLWEIDKEVKTSSRPLTFLVPTNQVYASVSRFIE
jgi:uncharacterized membrane protein